MRNLGEGHKDIFLTECSFYSTFESISKIKIFKKCLYRWESNLQYPLGHPVRQITVSLVSEKHPSFRFWKGWGPEPSCRQRRTVPAIKTGIIQMVESPLIVPPPLSSKTHSVSLMSSFPDISLKHYCLDKVTTPGEHRGTQWNSKSAAQWGPQLRGTIYTRCSKPNNGPSKTTMT